MAAFLEDLTPFYGTKERNKKGETLEEFLEKYDPDRYEHPSVTVDTVLLMHPHEVTTTEEGLRILLVRRGDHPSIGKWALPGGFVEMREDTIDAAKRELYEETGLTDIPMEQLRAFGQVDRDPRTRVITVAYLALAEEGTTVKAGDDAADAAFFDVNFRQVSEDVQENQCTSVYELTLVNEERNEKLSATVSLTENRRGLLAEPTLSILSSDGIAGDHPMIMTEALLRLSERIGEA